MEAPYDQLNPWGPDYDYWLALVRRLAPASVVDLGCGPGQLTVLIAEAASSAEVVGVDPDPAMLEVARTRANHGLVRWIDGHADAIPSGSADLIVMTSHVSQVFVSDDAWANALAEMVRALRPGGRIAFDMRNLLSEGWEAWNRHDTLRTIETDAGPAEVWHEVTAVIDGTVTYDTVTHWLRSGKTETHSDTLRFRTEAEIRTTLSDACFEIEDIHGEWDSTDATEDSAELIVTAALTARTS